MSLPLKELRNKLVIEGARVRLTELEQEREALLKILSLPISTNGEKGARILVAAKAIRERAHAEVKRTRAKGWTPKRLAKFRATMKKRYGAPKDWPSTKAAKGVKQDGTSN